jgi:2-aminobenzoate-CoA ligase
MKDVYPSDTTLPAEYLARPEDQPDYTDWPPSPVEGEANVGDYLSDRQVRAGNGDVVAAIHAETGESYTFRQLAQESDRLARGLLALGVKRGDRIAYRAPNVPDFLVVMIGALKAGAVVVPTPASARADELRFLLRDTGARFVFAHPRTTLEVVEAAVQGTPCEEMFAFGAGAETTGCRSWRELMTGEGAFARSPTTPNAVAILWHTGGTTGQPKACYHTHKRYIAAGLSLGEATGATVGQRWAATAPIGHALGLIHHTNYSMMHGATVVLIENYAKAEVVLDAVERWRITTLTGLAVTWAKMLQALEQNGNTDVSSLQRCYAMWQSASSSQVYDSWKARGIELLNNFGSTAFATWVLIPPLGEPSPRASLGCAAPGYEVAAVEVVGRTVRRLPPGTIGQMAVRGPSGLTYWNRPGLQQRDVVDGWTLSDDLIQFDAAGHAAYLGRTDYMISTAGHKVAPVEVEEVLSRHSSVREVAVVGAPCPIRQEIVAAYVVVREGLEKTEGLKDELVNFAKPILSSFKLPRRIEFIDALPRDSVGKVQTRTIKQWAAAAPEQLPPAQ